MLSDEITKLLVGQYGPVAFGLVALLVLWKAIVAPALASSKTDTDKLLAMAQLNRDTAEVLKEAIRELKTMMDHRLMRSPPPPREHT